MRSKYGRHDGLDRSEVTTTGGRIAPSRAGRPARDAAAANHVHRARIGVIERVDLDAMGHYYRHLLY